MTWNLCWLPHFKPVRSAYRLYWSRYPLFQESQIRVSSSLLLKAINGQVRRISTRLVYSSPWSPASYYFSLKYIHTWTSYLRNQPLSMGKTEAGQIIEKKPFQRLPKTVTPLHYDLFLKPNLESFIFDGNVSVNVQVSFWIETN